MTRGASRGLRGRSSSHPGGRAGAVGAAATLTETSLTPYTPREVAISTPAEGLPGQQDEVPDLVQLEEAAALLHEPEAEVLRAGLSPGFRRLHGWNALWQDVNESGRARG